MKKIKILIAVITAMLMITAVSCGGDTAEQTIGTSAVPSNVGSNVNIESNESQEQTASTMSDEGAASAAQSEEATSSTASNESTVASTATPPSEPSVSTVTSRPNNTAATSSQSTPSNSGAQQYGETFTEGDDNFSATDLTTAYSSDDVKIVLNGTSATVSGSGAAWADKRLSITEPGTYVLSGTLSDGQIYVNVTKEEKVQLVFDGVNITNKSSACVYVDSCDKTVITLAKGSKNTLTDASVYVFPSPGKTKPNACIFSDDDLTVNGSGELTVNANYNNGIGTDNDLKIIGATVKVTAINNALKGDYSFSSKDADITIVSEADGIKVDDDYRKDKGYIYIESGKFNITAADDALQAVTSITILSDTKVTTDCEGDSLNCGDTGVISVPAGVLTEN